MTTALASPPVAPDFGAIKLRQQAVWASGDYAVIGTMLQIVGEQLCRGDAAEGRRDVLDVAAGNGNATLAAARRFAEVTSTDYVPSLIERGRARAEAEGLSVAFREADAEALPFRGRELRRGDVDVRRDVHARPREGGGGDGAGGAAGGRIGMANWTPASFVGQIFRTIGQHVPPPAGLRRRRCGVAPRGSPNCFPVSRWMRRGGSSTSATSRRRTGSTCSAATTGRPIAPSRRSIPRGRRRSKPTSSSCSSGSTAAGPTR
jgi:SAM-dependent methyltransferase